MIVDIEVVPQPLGTDDGQVRDTSRPRSRSRRASGLHYEVNALGTTIEGAPDDVWPLAATHARVVPGIGCRARHHGVQDRTSTATTAPDPTIDGLTGKFRT